MKTTFILACTLAVSQAVTISVDQKSSDIADRNVIAKSEYGHNRMCAAYIDRLYNGSVDFHQIIKDGKPWEDPQFPPNEALYNTNFEGVKDIYWNEDNVEWKRVTELRPSQRSSLFGRNGISNFDIDQGALGNCWVMGPLSSISRIPNMVKNIFLTDDMNSAGIFATRLYALGQPVTVSVDDRLPVIEEGENYFKTIFG